MAYIFDEHKGKQDFETVIKPKLDALKTTFQSNVNAIYNKFVNQGTTPTAKTPVAISDAVDSLATAKYNAGVTATKKGNAGAGDVLKDKTFTNSSSVNAAGTMANNGAWTSTPTGSGKTTIPKGYHNGSGYVDTSTVYNNGYNSGVSATKKGNAGTGDVLSGKTFTNSSSVNATGAMANNGAKNYTVGVGSSQNIASGYHNGSGKVTGSISSATYITSQTESKTVSISNGVVGAYYIVMLSNEVPSNHPFEPTFTGCTSIQYNRNGNGSSHITLFYAIVKCTNANMSITFNVGTNGIMVLLKLG